MKIREMLDRLDEISRRDFLKGAGAAAGAAALGAPKGATAQNAPRDAVAYKSSGDEGDDWVRNPQHPDGWMRRSEYDQIYGNKSSQKTSQQSISQWVTYARKLALDSVGGVSDQYWDLRNWIAQNVSLFVEDYCNYTNSYNAKNVIDSVNETALDASGFKDTNWLLRGFGLYDLKRRANDFILTYKSGMLEKKKEFARLVQQQNQQQQIEKDVRGGFSPQEFDTILDALILYAICKDRQLENTNTFKTLATSIKKLIEVTNSKNQINELYKKAVQSVETLKSNPRLYQSESDQFFRNAGVIVQKLDKIAGSKKPEFEESIDEVATPDAVRRIEELIKY